MSKDVNAVKLFGEEYEYAGFWLRVGAFIIDTILLMIIIAPIITAIYGVNYWDNQKFIAGFWDFILNWIFPAVAVIAFWVYLQATPGKMVFKAIIVDEKTGNSPDIKQWIIRYIGYIPASLVFGLGIFWVGWDKKKQGWHDKLANTVVIRPKNKGVEPVKFS
jgi:uncharacterized RDD family membrane protein YckC